MNARLSYYLHNHLEKFLASLLGAMVCVATVFGFFVAYILPPPSITSQEELAAYNWKASSSASVEKGLFYVERVAYLDLPPSSQPVPSLQEQKKMQEAEARKHGFAGRQFP